MWKDWVCYIVVGKDRAGGKPVGMGVIFTLCGVLV